MTKYQSPWILKRQDLVLPSRKQAQRKIKGTTVGERVDPEWVIEAAGQSASKIALERSIDIAFNRGIICSVVASQVSYEIMLSGFSEEILEGRRPQGFPRLPHLGSEIRRSWLWPGTRLELSGVAMLGALSTPFS